MFISFKNNLSGLALTLTVIGGFIFFSGFSQEILAVAKGTIFYKVLLFGKHEFKNIIIPLDRIEEISVTNDFNMGNIKRFNKAIKVASDQGVFHFCHYTSDAEREWLADKLIELSSKQNA